MNTVTRGGFAPLMFLAMAVREFAVAPVHEFAGVVLSPNAERISLGVHSLQKMPF
jgi:hypothetical protein